MRPFGKTALGKTLLRKTIAPPWAAMMASGIWYQISGDTPDLGLSPTRRGTRFLADGDPALDLQLNPPWSSRERLRRLLGKRPSSPWAGRAGFAAITEAWNGAVLATRTGQAGSMVIYGGGHDDYFGSDVHRFDLATRRWSRISDGYVNGSGSEYGAGAVYPSATYPDHSPLPPHTYEYVQYDVVDNNLILLKGQTELGPQVKAVAIPHVLNLDSVTWRSGPKHQSAIFNSGGCSTWDARRRVIWGHSGDDGGGNGLSWFCPDGVHDDGSIGHWGPLFGRKLPAPTNHNAMEIDPDGDLILVTDHGANAMHAIDPESPQAPLTELTEIGDRPDLTPYSALEYSQRLNCFVYFSAQHSPHVYALSRPNADTKTRLIERAWRWFELSKPQARFDPVVDAQQKTQFEANTSHVFGRFRVVDYVDLTLAILVRHVDTPVYAIKLDTPEVDASGLAAESV